MNIVTLHLTCANSAEADLIANALLNDKFAACVKQQSVSSAYWWNGSIEKSEEILLIIETVAELFERIETKINELHSYDTFVLLQYSVSRTSAGVKEWLNENTSLTE